jgi:hypothetical protein
MLFIDLTAFGFVVLRPIYHKNMNLNINIGSHFSAFSVHVWFHICLVKQQKRKSATSNLLFRPLHLWALKPLPTLLFVCFLFFEPLFYTKKQWINTNHVNSGKRAFYYILLLPLTCLSCVVEGWNTCNRPLYQFALSDFVICPFCCRAKNSRFITSAGGGVGAWSLEKNPVKKHFTFFQIWNHILENLLFDNFRRNSDVRSNVLLFFFFFFFRTNSHYYMVEPGRNLYYVPALFSAPHMSNFRT